MSKPLILLTGCSDSWAPLYSFTDASPLAAVYELLPVGADQLDLTDSEDVTAYLDQLRPPVSDQYSSHGSGYRRVRSIGRFKVYRDAVLVLQDGAKER